MHEKRHLDFLSARERAFNNREVVNEIPCPEFWTVELAQKWATEIPEFLEFNTRETPIIELDLTQEDKNKGGLGKIWIKDESRRDINPTGTMKDRIGRTMVSRYKYEAQEQLALLQTVPNYDKRLPHIRLSRYSLLTSGNAGLALARAFARYQLPPPKLLLDSHISPQTIDSLKHSAADIYLADLSSNPFTGERSEKEPLDPKQIKIITNNERGRDLTSSGGGNPNVEVWSIFYHPMIRDVFANNPDEIYAPYGSGVLLSEFLVAQHMAVLSKAAGDSPKHLDEATQQILKHIEKIKIMGAEPKDPYSIADKLTAPAKPFAEAFQVALREYKQYGETPIESGVGKVSETEIQEAFELMKKYGGPQGLKTEPSACAGLALYIKRKRAGLIPENNKVVVINTGCGIVNEKAA